VTLKWAMSLDGKIATAAGQSQWISSPAGRRWGLLQREGHDAVLVGQRHRARRRPAPRPAAGPRRPPGPGAWSSTGSLRVPPGARLFEGAASRTAEDRCSLYTAREADAGGGAGARARPAPPSSRLARVEPAAVLAELHRRGLRSVLVEGGARVAAAFVEAGLYDRVATDCAPLLLGGAGAPGPLAGSRRPDPRSGRPASTGSAPTAAAPTSSSPAYRHGCLPDLLRSVGAS
jgi:diaminohydroxyphosphoribosylaminopyrimidine deaminase / 5-amino-6-(5-phosphoribosylamino)uracil reductase